MGLALSLRHLTEGLKAETPLLYSDVSRGQTVSRTAPCHLHLSLSLKLGQVNLDCNCLSLKRRKVTWPTTDPETWSQSHCKALEKLRFVVLIPKNIAYGITWEGMSILGLGEKLKNEVATKKVEKKNVRLKGVFLG